MNKFNILLVARENVQCTMNMHQRVYKTFQYLPILPMPSKDQTKISRHCAAVQGRQSLLLLALAQEFSFYAHNMLACLHNQNIPREHAEHSELNYNYVFRKVKISILGQLFKLLLSWNLLTNKTLRLIYLYFSLSKLRVKNCRTKPGSNKGHSVGRLLPTF